MSEEIKEIPLNKGEVAIVDDEDYEMLAKVHWWVNSQGYAAGKEWIDGKSIRLLMHRVIMNPPRDKLVDHINGNTLDNRKVNLRICEARENRFNIAVKKDKKGSIYKGVFKHTRVSGVDAFQMVIQKDGDTLRLSFDNEVAAANAYNYYSVELFGEYARKNDCHLMTKEEWEKHKLTTSYTSEYIGVNYNQQSGNWNAHIHIKNSKTIHLGAFETEIEAAVCYNRKARELYGEDAKLNKINNEYQIVIKPILKNKTSSFKGINYDNKKKKWIARVYFEGKRYYVGTFNSEEKAREAYVIKEQEIKQGGC